MAEPGDDRTVVDRLRQMLEDDEQKRADAERDGRNEALAPMLHAGQAPYARENAVEAG
jgi:hypothetical protein